MNINISIIIVIDPIMQVLYLVKRVKDINTLLKELGQTI